MISEKELELLRTAGITVDDALSRFSGNLGLYERFLRKFPEDSTFSELEDGLAKVDMELVFTSAHTLKGVTGNLGFLELFESSAELVTRLRESVEPLEAADAQRWAQRFDTEYQVIISAIESL